MDKEKEEKTEEETTVANMDESDWHFLLEEIEHH